MSRFLISGERTSTILLLDIAILFSVWYYSNVYLLLLQMDEVMAKTKTPFLSLGAHGSVGESITAQKRPAFTLIREKPFPIDPYSLPQAYQRWLYQDYAYLWTQQSAATRADYRSRGSRYHLTGFQYWMRVMLRTLPDIVGMWHLDEKLGLSAKDFSRNDNDLTIFGASPSDGLIDGSQLLDGLNDNLVTPANLVNAPLGASPRTFECFIKCSIINRVNYVFVYGAILVDKLCVLMTKWAAPWGTLVFAFNADNFVTSLIITQDQWHYVAALVVDLNTAIVQLDETEEQGNLAGPINTTLSPLILGSSQTGTSWWPGNLDHATLYNRLLNKSERDRHAARRYSL